MLKLLTFLVIGLASYSDFSHTTHVNKQKLACDSCHKFPTENWKEVRKGDAAFPDVTEFPEHASCLNCHRQQFFARERPVPKICSNCHVKATPRDTSRHRFRALGEGRKLCLRVPRRLSHTTSTPTRIAPTAIKTLSRRAKKRPGHDQSLTQCASRVTTRRVSSLLCLQTATRVTSKQLRKNFSLTQCRKDHQRQTIHSSNTRIAITRDFPVCCAIVVKTIRRNRRCRAKQHMRLARAVTRNSFQIQPSEICTICHTDAQSGKVKAFPPLRSFDARFDHAKHSGAACASCHRRNRGGVRLSIPARLNAHVTCFSCHTPAAQSNGRNISSCSTCHQLGRLVRTSEQAPAYRVGFSHASHDASEKLNCAACHQVRAGLSRGRQVSAPVPLNHHASPRAFSCASCHNGQRAFGGDDFTACKRCHKGPQWRF